MNKSTVQKIYDEIKTPYKYGAVVRDKDYLTDSPSVFKHNGKWYMYYIKINKDTNVSGYESHLSSSDDLIHWHYEGRLFKANECSDWDAKQCAGYGAYIDNNFGGSNEIQKVNDKYYVLYLGGARFGYEPDPLHMGQASSDDPSKPESFVRFKKPVLSPLDDDARRYERTTIYKGNAFIDEKMTLGHRYVNFYNAKADDTKERIYVAVSDDGENWERYGEEPVIDETEMIEELKISGDPQIVKLDNVYVMIYFRAVWQEEKLVTYNTFAVSEDLMNWTQWDGKPLIESEHPWESTYAHKNCVVKDGDTVYHFYCAVNHLDGSEDRFIALATSKELDK